MALIEIFADIGCPFTHVSLRWLLAKRKESATALPPLRIRPWPLELVNGRPLDPHFIAHEIDEIRTQVAPELFAGFSVESFPKTFLPAMALVEAAYKVNGTTGEAISVALRDAVFEEGLDVQDPSVLAALAKTHGVEFPNPDDFTFVLEQFESGMARGVNGSPHFFCGKSNTFCPTLEIHSNDGHFQIERRRDTLDQFLRQCNEDELSLGLA